MIFKKEDVKELRVDINNALKSVCKKHNITLDLGTIRYGERDFSGKLTGFVPENESGEVEDKIAYDFKKNCGKYGFSPDDIYKEFFSQGERFKIVGLKPRNRKYPIIAEKVVNGKSFKFSGEVVKIKLLLIEKLEGDKDAV